MRRPASRIISMICMSMLLSVSAYGQNCYEKLDEAQRAYYNGNFSKVKSLLLSCIGDQNLGADDITARELIIKAELLLANEKAAKDQMQALLRKYPSYSPAYVDLIQYKNLLLNYDVNEKFSYGLISGINVPFYSIMNYQSYGSDTEEPSDYEGNLGFSGGIDATYYFLKNVGINLSLLLQTTSYSQSETIQGYQEVRINESMSFLSLPLLAQYKFEFKKFQLSLGAGGVLHSRLSSKADLQLIPSSDDRLIPFIGVPQDEDNYDISDQRKSLTYGYVGRVTAKRRFNKNYVSLTIAYEYGLNNQVNTSNRLADDYLLETYSYVPDDFKYDLFKVMISYGFSTFKVEEK